LTGLGFHNYPICSTLLYVQACNHRGILVISVAYACNVARMHVMAKFKCAPLQNNLNIGYKYNFYES